MSHVVAVIDHRFADLEPERRILEAVDALVTDARDLPSAAILELCAGVDAVLLGARFPLDAAALSAMRRCRVIVRYGVGTDNVDVEAAARRGIWVACVPDYCTEEVATHAIALLLAANRRLGGFDADVRAGRWGIAPGLELRRLSTCVLGVVGFGRIGEAVATRAVALGMTVLAFDPLRPAAEIAAVGARPAGLDELLAAADYVSLHAPGADGPLLDAGRIARMKRGAVIVNVARGSLVDQAALVEALHAGRLGGAGIDVAAAEPLAPGDPLLGAPDVTVTPHAAWYSLEAAAELRLKAAGEVARVLAGGVPLHAVNMPAGG